MAGFNLFNTNNTTSAQTAPFGASSVTTSSNILFGSNSAAFNSQASAQNQSFGASSTTGNISFGLPKAQTNLSFGTTGSNTVAGGFGGQPNLSFSTPNQSGVSFGTVAPHTNSSFGNVTPQTNSSFGTVAPQPNPSFGTVAPQPNSNFGTVAPQPNSNFGTVAPQPTSNFGTVAPQPNSNFGTVAPQPNSSFGTPGTQSNSTFGTLGTQPNATLGTSGMQANSTFGVMSSQPNTLFGTSTAQSTSFGSQGSLPSFGSLKPQNTTAGSNLFSTASTPQTTILSGMSTPSTNTNVVKPTFGGSTFVANSSANQTGLSFGVQPSGGLTNTAQVTTNTSQPSLFSLTTTSVPATVVTTGQPFKLGSTTQSISFSASIPSVTTSIPSTQPTTSQTGLSGLTFGTATTSAPSLSFGGSNTIIVSTSTTTASGLLNPSFGVTSTTASSGIFSWPKSTSEAPITSSSVSVGLGGIDHTAVSTTQSAANTVVSAKEQMLPNEIQQTVATFKEYVKTQKNLSSEVARTSAEPLTKLTQQIGALNNLVLTLGSILSQQKFTAEKIKLETIKSLNDYELAQKIKDSPVASEERMFAIRKYFTEKISAFEESTKTLQEKIEYVYQHVITLPQENSLSAEALKLIVKKLHDSFVVIGARAYKLHNDMQLLKVQYLTLRNQYVKDNSSISFSLNRELQLPLSEIRSKSNNSEFSLEGPNPFSRTADGSFNSLLLASQSRNFPPSTTPSKDWNAASFSNTKPFGFTDVSSNISFDQNSNPNLSTSPQINLQKPPIGNKRGKR